MVNSNRSSVLLDLIDGNTADSLASALLAADLDVFALESRAPEKALRETGADFLVVDGTGWGDLAASLSLPPRAYLILVLLDPEDEALGPAILEAEAFDCLLRDGPGWEVRAACYLKALGALRRRFTRAFSTLERRYEHLVHALPDIIYELDAEGRFTFINNSIKILGYEPSELAGKHFSVLLHEEDAKVVDRDSILSIFSGAKTGLVLSPKLFNERRSFERRTEGLEVRLRRNPAAGGGDDILVSVIAYGEVSAAGEYASREGGGDFLGTVGVIRDVTLRRKSEDMLRKLYQAVDQLASGIVIVDHNFIVEYLNPAFLRLTRHVPAEVVGTGFFSLFEAGQSMTAEIRSLVHEGLDAQKEMKLLVTGGDPFWVACRVSPVRTPTGDVTHAIAILEDVSQRHAMEELLRTAKDEAANAVRAKSDFLASMSHELKSPVSGILAAARLIEMGDGDPVKRARSIIGDAQGLLGLLGDMLDYVRFESGQATIRKYAFPLSGFVLRCVEPFRAIAAARGLSFEVAPLPEEIVTTDLDRLERAFGALLDNAIAYTEKGGVRVEAKLERREGNVPFLLLSVADTGAGIAPADQLRIFLPFVQGTSPYDKAAGVGVGLGLPLARNIVRALGGELRLDSESGRGSTFTILVPVGELEQVQASVKPASGFLRGQRVYRLLVVDDNEVNLAYMAAILENAGQRVTTASSGAMALKALDDFLPDAALLDIQMPGMSGIELARRIRALTGEGCDPSLPLVALTAFDAQEIESQSGDFAAVFPKPMDLRLLLEALDRAVDEAEATIPLSAPPTAFPRVVARSMDAIPGFLDRLASTYESGDEEAFRKAARELGPHLANVGAVREEAALRRILLAMSREDGIVTLCRLKRLRDIWAGRESPRAGGR